MLVLVLENEGFFVAIRLLGLPRMCLPAHIWLPQRRFCINDYPQIDRL